MDILKLIEDFFQVTWENIAFPLQGDNLAILGDRGYVH